MLKKILEKRNLKKRDAFYLEGFKEGSYDVVVLLTTEPVPVFNEPDEIIDMMSDRMITFTQASEKCKSRDPEMIKGFMSGYNKALAKVSKVLKQRMLDRDAHHKSLVKE